MPDGPCQGQPEVRAPRLAFHPPRGSRASDPRGRDGPRDWATTRPGAGPHPGRRLGRRVLGLWLWLRLRFQQACGAARPGPDWRASSGAGPVPLTTARATAPHSGQTALRHSAPVPRPGRGLPGTPLVPQSDHSEILPNLSSRKSTFPYSRVTACLPEILTSQTRPLPVSILRPSLS